LAQAYIATLSPLILARTVRLRLYEQKMASSQAAHLQVEASQANSLQDAGLGRSTKLLWFAQGAGFALACLVLIGLFGGEALPLTSHAQAPSVSAQASQHGPVVAFLSSSPSSKVAVRKDGGELLSTWGYVPDGFTKAEWEKVQKKEKAASAKKINMDGTSGMQFKSRTFAEFQKGREDGTLTYNMPVEKAMERVRKGELKMEDIPYMQRPGGMPDGSDLKKYKKGFKFPWSK